MKLEQEKQGGPRGGVGRGSGRGGAGRRETSGDGLGAGLWKLPLEKRGWGRSGAERNPWGGAGGGALEADAAKWGWGRGQDKPLGWGWGRCFGNSNRRSWGEAGLWAGRGFRSSRGRSRAGFGAGRG